MTESRPAAFITSPPRRVVLLCVHNSSRSQMAEGFARHWAPSGTLVWSAGTEPTHVHPMAIEVMKEIGIDISDQTSKPLDDVPWADADTIVTLCGEAAEACPTVGDATRRVHWPLPDPSKAAADEQRDVFRTIRDEIRWRVASLWPKGD